MFSRNGSIFVKSKRILTIDNAMANHMGVFPDDYVTDSPLHRVSEDRGFNYNGSQLLDLCQQTGLRILNGRVGLDKNIGKYTFVGSQGKSAVDYVIASQDLFPSVCTFAVDDPNILSDHCIIYFSIQVTENFGTNKVENSSCSFIEYKYV